MSGLVFFFERASSGRTMAFALLRYASACLLFVGSCVALLPALRRTSLHRLQSPRRTRLATLPEHLIDCAANPKLADIYGGPGSPFCYQNDGGLGFGDVGALLEQTLSIGFIVAVYFLLRRTQGGVKEWMEAEVDEDEALEEDAFFADLRGDAPEGELTDAFQREDKARAARRSRARGEPAPGVVEGSPQPQQCPQCGGLGKLGWDSRQGLRECDMCLGVGAIALRNRGPRARTLRALPSKISTSALVGGEPRGLREKESTWQEGDEE